jgi:hypothetical protein
VEHKSGTEGKRVAYFGRFKTVTTKTADGEKPLSAAAKIRILGTGGAPEETVGTDYSDYSYTGVTWYIANNHGKWFGVCYGGADLAASTC